MHATIPTIPMYLTVKGTGIEHHPVKLPSMPIGTDIHFNLAVSNYFFFTITGYDVRVNSKTGAAETVTVFARISERNEGDCAKLKAYFEGMSEPNRQELLNTPTVNLFLNKPWARYEELKTLRKVVVKSDWELLRFRHLGKKSLAELKEKLAELGLTTGMKIP